jgi:hypothetical protein
VFVTPSLLSSSPPRCFCNSNGFSRRLLGAFGPCRCWYVVQRCVGTFWKPGIVGCDVIAVGWVGKELATEIQWWQMAACVSGLLVFNATPNACRSRVASSSPKPSQYGESGSDSLMRTLEFRPMIACRYLWCCAMVEANECRVAWV